MIFGEKWRSILSEADSVTDLPYGDELFKITDGLFYSLKKKIEQGKFSDIDYSSLEEDPEIDEDNYAFRLKNGDRVFLIDQYDPCLNCGEERNNSYYYLVKSHSGKRDVYKCIECGKMYYSYKDLVNSMIDSYATEDAIKIRNFDCTRHLFLVSKREEDVEEVIHKDIVRSLKKAEAFLQKHF